ncbi:MAG: DUF885 domain-containing protein [Phenylobacterium zucineum]|nr:MAG: DUF885 domain-containing protein [Phenylobacterium zucineum]
MADDAPLNALVAEFDAYALGQDPVTAGFEGDAKAMARLPDISIGADVLRRSSYEEFKQRLAAIDAAGLSPEGRLNRDVLAWTLDRRLEALAFDQARWAFDSDGGFDQMLGYLAAVTHIDTEADAEAWILRLRATPRLYVRGVENARRAVRTGFTQPKSVADQVLARARAAAAAPVETDPLLKPFEGAKLPAAKLAEMRAVAAKVVADEIRPAQRDLATFMEKEYVPAARKSLGVRSVKGGDAYYRFLVRDHTTTAMTPDEIHALGQSEVARIRGEMGKVMVEAGWSGDLASFIAMLRKDPRFYATSREELMEKASEIAKRADDQLPRWFQTLPRLPYGVRQVPAEIEEGYTTGRYFPGSPAQGVAGGYMVNTSHLDQRALYELPALTVHEAAPGHHIQIALAQELEGVPAFRRNAEVSAFTEGWGLYSEELAGQMGLYRTPYERFGRLSYEMWRACRLVADTGIHWMGWSLDKARTCFTENSALSPLNIEVELARYVSWPGQALAYKVGELKLLALRKRAADRLGPRFDIRRFHDAVLLAGPLPLDLLDARIDAWIAAEAVRPTKP